MVCGHKHTKKLCRVEVLLHSNIFARCLHRARRTVQQTMGQSTVVLPPDSLQYELMLHASIRDA